MKAFLKENIVLVLGLSLPIILIIVFLLSKYIFMIFTPNPKYDFLFSNRSYIPNFGLNNTEFSTKGGKLYMKIIPPYNEKLVVPSLYRYNIATGQVSEIKFIASDFSKYVVPSTRNKTNVMTNITIPIDPNKLPTSEQIQNTSKIVSELNNEPIPLSVIEIPLTELNNINLSDSDLSPDGYRIGDNTNDYLDFGLIGTSSYNYSKVLFKNQKRFPLAIGYNYKFGFHFIGWIIP